MTKTKVIGITGGIGSGKSVVSRILRLNDCLVYDCDLQAKILMKSSPELKEKLIEILGEGAYKKDGELNKSYISEKIFNDSLILEKVNNAVHKAVKSDILQIISEEERKYFFIESAIIFSSGISDFCDSVWLVEAPEKLRIERIKKRNGWTSEEILSRIKSQEKEFSNLPFYKLMIIKNDGITQILAPVVEYIKEPEKSKNSILC